MSKRILTGLFFFAIQVSWAQSQSEIDSLMNELRKPGKNKLVLYRQLNAAWAEGNFDSSWHYGKLLYQTALQQHDTISIIQGLRAIGLAYDYDYQGDSAQQYYEQALTLAEQKNDKRLTGSLYFNLGTLHLIRGQYPQAIPFYEQAMVWFEEDRDASEQELSKLYNNMGVLYRRTHHFEKAIDLYRKALQSTLVVGEEQQANLHINLANAFSSLKQYDSAQKYFYKAEEFARKHNNRVFEGYVANGLGIIAYDRNRYTEARMHFEKNAFDSQLTEANLKITALGYMGIIESKMKRYAVADTWFAKAMQYASDDNLTDQTMNLYGQMAEHYEQAGAFEQALDFQKKYATLNEHVLSKTVVDRTTEWVQRFNAKEKERQIAELDAQHQQARLMMQEKTNQRNVFIFSTLFFLMAAATALYLYRNRKKATQLLEEKNKTIQEALQINKLLNREIHHRVKNNLQVIISLLNLQSNFANNSATTAAMRDSKNRVFAMSLIHENLYTQQEGITLNVKEYLTALVNNLCGGLMRPDMRVEVSCMVEDHQIDADKAVPLGLIVNELVTNAFKHAFRESDEGLLSITYTRSETHATLIVQDNGVGISSERTASRKSLGMILIHDLAKKLRATLTIENQHGTVVMLIFPVL